MSILKLGSDNFEYITIKTNPSRVYHSSSAGITGSIQVLYGKSNREKDLLTFANSDEGVLTDNNIDAVHKALIQASQGSSTNISGSAQAYLDFISDSLFDNRRNNKKIKIFRFEPSFKLTKDSARKRIIIDKLYRHHKVRYPSLNFGFTNFNCLSFISSSMVPENAAIMYPNPYFSENKKGRYTPEKGFTFSFYVNPRRTTENNTADYTAGCVMHLSSSFAVSIVSGSLKDTLGRPSSFRVMLQLSQSADRDPSMVNLESVDNGLEAFPNDLTFLSKDLAIKKNNWHHVAVRWGGKLINNGTGSFIIDGEDAGTFNIFSSSICSPNYPAGSGQGDSQVLTIGNFYNGPNRVGNYQSSFFNTISSAQEGIQKIDAVDSDPGLFSLNNQLNADVHDIRIYNKFIEKGDIDKLRVSGDANLSENLIFYLPVHFVKESPNRQIMITPFHTRLTSSFAPFNHTLSFGVGGHLMNPENFLREFKSGVYPRLYNLTASTIQGLDEIDQDRLCNYLLYKSGSTRLRNNLIMPCDNGFFTPDYNILNSGSLDFSNRSSPNSMFVDDEGDLSLSKVSLRNIVRLKDHVNTAINKEEGDLFNSIAGSAPDNLQPNQESDILTVLQRTRDNTSNQCCFFDISNLFYGDRIKPGTFEIKDNALSGSSELIPNSSPVTNNFEITLRDNGLGGLYRSDAENTASKNAIVGTICYDEGQVTIFHPSLALFGKDSYTMSFEGERNVHTLKVNVVASKGMVNSSSSPVYELVSASFDANESDPKFVYLDGLYLHDENMNVISKTSFAQPIKKRSSDKYLFKVRIDY